MGGCFPSAVAIPETKAYDEMHKGVKDGVSRQPQRIGYIMGDDSFWDFDFDGDGDMDAEDDLIGDWLFMGYVEDELNQPTIPRPSKPPTDNPLAVIGGMVVFFLMLAIFFCGMMG